MRYFIDLYGSCAFRLISYSDKLCTGWNPLSIEQCVVQSLVSMEDNLRFLHVLEGITKQHPNKKSNMAEFCSEIDDQSEMLNNNPL